MIRLHCGATVKFTFVQVQESFELNHETLYTAVKLTDLYLAKKLVSAPFYFFFYLLCICLKSYLQKVRNSVILNASHLGQKVAAINQILR